MGATETKAMVQDFALNDSETRPKNWQYYNGERFFRVGRSQYPQYKHGYLFGYYLDDTYFQRILYESDAHGTEI